MRHQEVTFIHCFQAIGPSPVESLSVLRDQLRWWTAKVLHFAFRRLTIYGLTLVRKGRSIDISDLISLVTSLRSLDSWL